MNAQRQILDVFRRERAAPFKWGTADCLSWCAATAQEITGKDPMAALRGRYKSASGARRIMKRNGWNDMAAVARSLFEEIAPAQAATGDWAHVVNPDGTDTLGVFVGPAVVARTERDGLVQFPRTAALTAFRVRA